MSNELEPRSFTVRYGARIVGALCGLAIGILLLTIGFFKTILLVVLSGIGWLIGARLDGRWVVRMKNVLRRVLNEKD